MSGLRVLTGRGAHWVFDDRPNPTGRRCGAPARIALSRAPVRIIARMTFEGASLLAAATPVS